MALPLGILAGFGVILGGMKLIKPYLIHFMEWGKPWGRNPDCAFCLTGGSGSNSYCQRSYRLSGSLRAGEESQDRSHRQHPGKYGEEAGKKKTHPFPESGRASGKGFCQKTAGTVRIPKGCERFSGDPSGDGFWFQLSEVVEKKVGDIVGGQGLFRG